MASRPELVSPPEIFYDGVEARKYTRGSRMQDIQARLSQRAIELLLLPQGQPSLVLDIGCGSGLSGQCLEEAGHNWVGMDISPDMLEVAVERGATEGAGDAAHGDMGQGFPFRPGMFDGAISISALQWLFYPSKKSHNPFKRLATFFDSLYSCLHRGSRAVLQFYPENPQQMEMAVRTATQCGFTGGLVVDYPNSAKAKKYYLVITAGTSHTYLGGRDVRSSAAETSQSRGGNGGFAVRFERESGRKRKMGRKRGKRVAPRNSREWILQKKERQRRQGRKVRRDTKYSGRKRKDKF